MYSTESKNRPSRPVVTGASQAQSEVDNWVNENNFRSLTDGSGLVWQLRIAVLEKPRSQDLHGGQWEITFHMFSEHPVEAFVAAGTLDSAKDERLIGLCGEGAIRITLKPFRVVADSLEGARTAIADGVANLRKSMNADGLHAIKRQLIGEYLDRISTFGGRDAL